jgi:hypothetical protein
VEALEDRTVPSFAGPVAFTLPAPPQAVAVGHLEGASAPADVVTADANGVVSVLLGRGDGSLQNPVSIPLGGSLTSVAVGGLLRNGLQDVVAGNANGTVSVLLSNGDGTFQAPTVIAVGATPRAVAVGDFNGDGKPDILTANSNGTLTVLPGNGNGTFLGPITSTVGGSFTSLAVGYFNGDARPDLAVGTGAGLDVLLGNGDGTFQLKSTITFPVSASMPELTQPVSAVAVGDFNGDGKGDIVANASGPLGGNLSILLGNGDGTFQAPVSLNVGGIQVASVIVGDFTGDGKADVVTGNAAPPNSGGPTLSLLAGNGNGTFQAHRTVNLGETGDALAAADFNGDGKLDLALASRSGANVAVLFNGGGTFATTPAYPGNVLPSAEAAGDFNGDGKQDLVVTGIGGNAAVLINNGDGTFRAGPTLTVPGSPTSVVVGDFNGDGRQDVAVGTQQGTVYVFRGNGNGTFGTALVFNLGTNNSVQSLAAGDFNGDGKLDLAVTSNQLPADTGLVTILLGKGTGTFTRGQVTTVGVDGEGLTVTDLNGDGKADLVTTSLLPGGLRDVKVLLGIGNGTFQKPIAVTPGSRATSLAAGDFNGDGKQDLVLVDRFSSTVSVLPGNGNGTFQIPIVFQFNLPVVGLGGPAVGDFFKTGKMSVAVTTGVGAVSVLQGNGDGTFQAAVNYLVGYHGTQPSTVIAGNFGGGGKLDLAATNALTNDVSVLLNTTTPPVAAAPVATATSLSADVNPAVFGQPVDVTATVTAAKGTPTGTVTFYDGGTVLAEVALDPNGQAVFVAKLGVGPHALRAVFAGTGGFTGSKAALTETVNKAATTTAITAGTIPVLAGVVFVTATVAPVAPGAGRPTGVVTFFDGATVVGTAVVDANGQATLMLYGLSAGTHALTASYGGDGNFLGSTSDILTIMI